MKYLFVLLLFILVSCKVVEQVDKEKIAVVVDKTWIEHNQIVTVDRYIRLKILFSQGQSKNLTPRVYILRDTKALVAHSGRVHPQNQTIYLIVPNTHYEWDIVFKQPGTVTILFIWEGKNVVGDKKLIHFKSI